MKAHLDAVRLTDAGTGAPPKELAVAQEDVALPLEGATEARICISHGAGRLQIRGGAGSDQLATGRCAGGVVYEVRREGSLADVNMRVEGKGLLATLLPWKRPGTCGAEWNLALNEAIPLKLKIDGGASDNRLDLSSLRVEELLLVTGASATKLTLPAAAGEARAEVTCGMGQVEIQIPSGVAARIYVQSSMAETTVDLSRFPGVDSGLYESPDYETATNKVELRLEASLGLLDIR
jgi:hypothetical protein